MDHVPTLNLYFDEKTKKKLKELSDKENRPISRQVKHMMEFYIKNKDKVK